MKSFSNLQICCTWRIFRHYGHKCGNLSPSVIASKRSLRGNPLFIFTCKTQKQKLTLRHCERRARARQSRMLKTLNLFSCKNKNINCFYFVYIFNSSGLLRQSLRSFLAMTERGKRFCSLPAMMESVAIHSLLYKTFQTHKSDTHNAFSTIEKNKSPLLSLRA